MSNPWLKKNPFMSLWLSGFNTVANTARGHAVAATKAAGTAAAKQGANAWLDFWTQAMPPKAPAADAAPAHRTTARKTATKKTATRRTTARKAR